MIREQCWIVAAPRRDGTAPSIVKALAACSEPDAALVFCVKADAERCARTRSAIGAIEFQVFEVSVVVKSPRRAKTNG